jgi:gliding motility-associated-like protein
VFGLLGRNAPCVVRFDIYDRWGSLVFQTNNPTDVWRGLSLDGGQEVPEGVYIFVVETSYGIQRTGTVTLLR